MIVGVGRNYLEVMEREMEPSTGKLCFPGATGCIKLLFVTYIYDGIIHI